MCFAAGRILFSNDASFKGGSTVNFQNDLGFGLGFGYNLDEHWLIGLEFGFNRLGYTGTLVSADTPQLPSATISGTADTARLALSATYNILPRALTPSITANVGFNWVDTNIADGPPQTGCWWDPWWGYICTTVQSTHQDTGFTYGVGAGLRWDASHSFFLRVGYEHDWADFGNTSSTPSFDLMRLQFGTRY